MYCLLVRFRTRDEDAALRFDALVEPAVAQIAAAEPGTLVYATHRPTDEPLTRVFYEVYQDDEAFRRHEQAPYVVEFLTSLQELLVGPPEVEVLEVGPFTGWPQQ